MRPSSWNGVGAIANVPLASAVSFVMVPLLSPLSFRGGPNGRTRNLKVPGSMLRRKIAMQSCASIAPERQLLEPPRRLLHLLLGEEDVLGVGDDILGLPSRKRRCPAFHLHHPHLAHA